MRPPPREESAPPPDFPDVNEEVVAARDALLRFAEAENALDLLVGNSSEPATRYPDIAAVRRYATVDELLQLVARIPEADDEREGHEATSLYASLLQLAEALDIIIDQHSLVYGDAVALAEAMLEGWRDLAGCDEGSSVSAEAGGGDVAQVNLAAAIRSLDEVQRLGPEVRRATLARFQGAREDAWRSEARRMAVRASESCLPVATADTRIAQAIAPARRWPPTVQAGDSQAELALATGDLVLSRLVRGISHPAICQVLERPLAELLPAS